MPGYATLLRNERMDRITNTSGSNSLLTIYAGTRPATGGTSTVVLASFLMSTTFAPPASSGILRPNSTSPAVFTTTAVFSSTATWARHQTSSGTFIADYSVSTAAADFILNTNVITSGVTVTITQAQITEGNP